MHWTGNPEKGLGLFWSRLNWLDNVPFLPFTGFCCQHQAQLAATQCSLSIVQAWAVGVFQLMDIHWCNDDDGLLLDFRHHLKISATWKPKVTFNNKLSSNHFFPPTKLASWKPQMERCWWWTRVHSNVSIPRTRPRPVNSCTFFVFSPSVAAWQLHNALTTPRLLFWEKSKKLKSLENIPTRTKPSAN